MEQATIDRIEPMASLPKYKNAALEFEINASSSTVEEVNSLIEKICAVHEQKRFLTIKVKM